MKARYHPFVMPDDEVHAMPSHASDWRPRAIAAVLCLAGFAAVALDSQEIHTYATWHAVVLTLVGVAAFVGLCLSLASIANLP